MHHWMSKPDWLDELNDELRKRGSATVLDFDQHFVLVEEDWACGRDTEDVARRIAEDQHERIAAWRTQQAEAAHLANA